MGDAMKIAAQGSANQIFSTTFWVLGFLPSVITPLIAKAHASKDEKAVQKHVGEALAMAVAIGIIGTAIVVLLPQLLLNVRSPRTSPY
jgi:MATE family multidrug resistance protein